VLTPVQRATVVPPGPPSSPRLELAESRTDRSVLDGAWWPRSTDPVAELPGLVVALAARYGPVHRLMLNADAWDTRVRRLAVGGGVVRIGWFSTVDPAVVVATTDRGTQIDLLVVPPATGEDEAKAMMAAAAAPTNRLRAPDILHPA
jgi:hypothetical protein